MHIIKFIQCTMNLLTQYEEDPKRGRFRADARVANDHLKALEHETKRLGLEQTNIKVDLRDSTMELHILLTRASQILCAAAEKHDDFPGSYRDLCIHVASAINWLNQCADECGNGIDTVSIHLHGDDMAWVVSSGKKAAPHGELSRAKV